MCLRSFISFILKSREQSPSQFTLSQFLTWVSESFRIHFPDPRSASPPFRSPLPGAAKGIFAKCKSDPVTPPLKSSQLHLIAFRIKSKLSVWFTRPFSIFCFSSAPLAGLTPSVQTCQLPQAWLPPCSVQMTVAYFSLSD